MNTTNLIQIGTLIIMLAVGFGCGVWFGRKRQGQSALRKGFAETEITKMFKLITDDVNGLSQSLKTQTTADDDSSFERLKYTINKMEMYIKKEIEKINI